MRYNLLAALCYVRETEITDSLLELFIRLVQKINTGVGLKVAHASERSSAACGQPDRLAGPWLGPVPRRRVACGRALARQGSSTGQSCATTSVLPAH
ncbi:hypothetical protein [Streptomyces sp. NPDC060366]|uniref:hypothetical protein n=1 Tax=Streptomyces sp. NPDC060366 TaxID=3347105 RepID=UPI00364A207A